MRTALTKLFSPILSPLENAEGEYAYSPSHRTVLKIMGFLFMFIAAVGLYFSLKIDLLEGLFAVVIFGGIGIWCEIVAFLGSDKAVAKIWRNRN